MFESPLIDPTRGPAMWNRHCSRSIAVYLVCLMVGAASCRGSKPDADATDMAETSSESTQPDGLIAWRSAELNHPHLSGMSARLDDRRAMLIGGYGDLRGGVSDQTEIYSADEGRWREAASLNGARRNASVTRLTDGRLLVIGGQDSGTSFLKSAEIYDPDSDRWTEVSPMPDSRTDHTATRLPDGTVLVVGGRGRTDEADGERTDRHTCLIYDPSADDWRETSPLEHPRHTHAAGRVDGEVVVIGGYGEAPEGTDIAKSVRIYDPSDETWRAGPSMHVAREEPHLWSLTDDRLLVAAPADWKSPGLQDRPAEIYEPSNEAWTETAIPNEATDLPRDATLPEGPTFRLSPWEVVIFDRQNEAWRALPTLSRYREGASLLRLSQDHLLVAGGVGLQGELYTSSQHTRRVPESELDDAVPRESIALPDEGTLADAHAALLDHRDDLEDQTCVFIWGMGADELLGDRGTPVSLTNAHHSLDGRLVCGTRRTIDDTLEGVGVRGPVVVRWKDGEFVASHPHPSSKGSAFLDGELPPAGRGKFPGMGHFQIRQYQEVPLARFFEAAEFARRHLTISVVGLHPVNPEARPDEEP